MSEPSSAAVTDENLGLLKAQVEGLDLDKTVNNE